jgi:NADPH:quinone reductase
MSTMKAVFIRKQGGLEALEYGDLPIPKPGKDEILIKNSFAGINFKDT